MRLAEHGLKPANIILKSTAQATDKPQDTSMSCLSWKIYLKLPVHAGTLSLHSPSLHVMLLAPLSLNPNWHRNFTLLPLRKSSPIRRPFCGVPGSVHLSE